MLQRVKSVCILISSSVLVGCQHPSGAVTTHQTDAPIFDGLGSHERPITTDSKRAQQYFNQGLVWMYGFNHDEAIRAFQSATHHDPECAMAWWGIALCHGPHINNPSVPPERAQAAWTALQKALKHIHHTNPVERSLILALQARYADPQPDDRTPLDRAYAESMRSVYQQYPDDADVITLYAESLMDLWPWNLWTKDGTPQPQTEEILSLLEHAMTLSPDHPGVHHLYIHAVEAAHPRKALASADKLRTLVPASSHLVHMSSHIDVLTGQWEKACLQNKRAVKADQQYLRLSPNPDFYRLYMAHNYHMLSFAAQMSGQSQLAIQAGRDVIEQIPEEHKRKNAVWLDAYMGAKYDAFKRFGMWDEILAEPAPPAYFPITTAMWRFNRGLAYAAKGEVALAHQENEAFKRATENVPEDAIAAINPAHDILLIAQHMLDGEIAYREGQIDEAIKHLHLAIEKEDNLRYMEPPEWIQPVRHTLGAILLENGRYHEAENVYRQDLKEWPENGWSLYGLHRALHHQSKTKEAGEVKARFDRVWANADVPMTSSCLCVPGTPSPS